MSWNPLDEPVDFAILGGQRTPGLAELVEGAVVYRWDERRGYGISGATSVFKGQGLSRLKLLIRLYTAEDWDNWAAFKPLLAAPRPDPSEAAALSRLRPRALEIVHPIAEMLGVRAVTIETWKQPTQTGDGEWTIEIALLEYRRPQFAASKPEGAQDRPIDPADQSIAALTSIVQNGGEGDVLQALAPLGRL